MSRELVSLTAEPGDDVIDVLRAFIERFIVLAARFPANLFIVTQEGARGGPPPRDPRAVARQAKEVAEILLRGILVEPHRRPTQDAPARASRSAIW